MTTEPSAPAVPQDDDEISLLDLLQVVADNLRLLVLGPLAAGLVALGISFAIAPTFTATTKFMPPQQGGSGEAALLKSLGALGGIGGAVAGIKNPNDQFIGFLKSVSIADELIAKNNLLERYKAKFKVDARKALDSNTRATSGKDGFISLEFDDKDPEFAAKIANAYVTELSNLLARISLTEAQQRRAFYERQLSQTKESLLKAEIVLKSSGVNSAVLKSNPGAALSGVAQLQAQITVLEVKLGSMRGYLADSAPEFRQAQTELAALRSQLAKASVDESTVTGADADYLTRYRDVKYFEALFELFARQYELAKTDEAREGNVIQVVDYAKPPERKSKPKKAQIAMLTTLAVGFALLLFVFIRQAMRGASQTPDTAEKLGRLHQAWARALGRT